jgi:hypothetical protein
MKLSLNEKTKVLLCIILLFSITLVIFQYTVSIREPWFGELSDGHHQWLTGSTLEFTENWYNEGPVNLDFAMIQNPASIEFPTLLSRDPYLSYPPGTIIPIYFASEIIGHKPTVGLIMDYNLFNHFLIAFFLALIIFFFLRYLKYDILNSFLFSIIPIMLELLLPAPLYWHQNAFFSDQAIILPFVVYIFLEVLRDRFRNLPKNRNIHILNILQNIVLFYGFLTDWLFVFIGLTVYIKRIVDGEIVLSREMFFNKRINLFIKESIKYWFTPLLALFLFVVQIFAVGSFNSVLSKSLFRMGVTPTGETYLNNGMNLFIGNITLNYGHVAVGLIAASLTFFILTSIYLIFGRFKAHKNIFKIKRTLYLIGMLLIPCILQVLVFRNHSVIHDFSVLKFSIPLATIPFVLLPIMIFLFFEKSIDKKLKNINVLNKFNGINRGLLALFLIVFVAASFYIVNEHSDYKIMFTAPNGTYEVIGTSLEENTGYNDVVFSPDFEISENPPQQLAYSMKRVYQVNSTEDIKDKIKGINGNYDIVVMFLNPPSDYWIKVLSNATMVKDGDIYYYRVKSNILP